MNIQYKDRVAESDNRVSGGSQKPRGISPKLFLRYQKMLALRGALIFRTDPKDGEVFYVLDYRRRRQLLKSLTSVALVVSFLEKKR